MAEISLKLKRPPVVPDFETHVYTVYEDIANPLDSGEFPEIPVKIQITAEATEEYIETIMSEALEKAKLDAQEKANKKELQTVFNSLLADYADKAPVELFKGTVEGVSEYIVVKDIKREP